MDRIKTFMNSMNIPNKVSVINEDGEVVLDTLVRPYVNGVDYQDVTQIAGHGSMESIHGVKAEWLSDAPTFQSVREHVLQLCGRGGKGLTSNVENEAEGQIHQDGSPLREKTDDLENEEKKEANSENESILVGHGILHDLKVLDIFDVTYICTQVIDQDPFRKQPKKLKHLVQKYLNAQIQDGHHSSIIDARATLALFLF